MTSDLYTLGALALVLVLGWLLDHLDPWRRSRLYGEALRRLKKYAALAGVPLR